MSVRVTWKPRDRDDPLTKFAKANGMEVHDGDLVALNFDGSIRAVIGREDLRVSDSKVHLKAADGSWWRKTNDGWESAEAA